MSSSKIFETICATLTNYNALSKIIWIVVYLYSLCSCSGYAIFCIADSNTCHLHHQDFWCYSIISIRQYLGCIITIDSSNNHTSFIKAIAFIILSISRRITDNDRGQIHNSDCLSCSLCNTFSCVTHSNSCISLTKCSIRTYTITAYNSTLTIRKSSCNKHTSSIKVFIEFVDCLIRRISNSNRHQIRGFTNCNILICFSCHTIFCIGNSNCVILFRECSCRLPSIGSNGLVSTIRIESFHNHTCVIKCIIYIIINSIWRLCNLNLS